MYNTFPEISILILKEEENYQSESAGNSNFFREFFFSRLISLIGYLKEEIPESINMTSDNCGPQMSYKKGVIPQKAVCLIRYWC